MLECGETEEGGATEVIVVMIIVVMEILLLSKMSACKTCPQAIRPENAEKVRDDKCDCFLIIKKMNEKGLSFLKETLTPRAKLLGDFLTEEEKHLFSEVGVRF